jgi:hypothetical protein
MFTVISYRVKFFVIHFPNSDTCLFDFVEDAFVTQVCAILSLCSYVGKGKVDGASMLSTTVGNRISAFPDHR